MMRAFSALGAAAAETNRLDRKTRELEAFDTLPAA